MKYLIGFFSTRANNGVKAFHIVEQRDTIEEVKAYVSTHTSYKLVVFERFEVTE